MRVFIAIVGRTTLLLLLFTLVAGADWTREEQQAGSNLKKETLKAAAAYVRELTTGIRQAATPAERADIEARLADAKRAQVAARNMSADEYVQKAIDGVDADSLIGRKPPPLLLTLADLEVGRTGYLTFPVLPNTRPTLLPLKTEDVEKSQFIGSITSAKTAKRTAIIVRNVNTEGLVTGRYFQLDGEIHVTGTEEVSNGETVFVIQPVSRERFRLKPSMSPDLERPVPR